MLGIRARKIARLAPVVCAVFMMTSLATPASASPPAKPVSGTWGASGAVKAQVIVGSTLYLGGTFSNMIAPDGTTLVPRKNLAAIDLVTGDLLPWAPTANRGVEAMVSDGTNLYLGGAFTVVNGKTRKRLAAVDATGALLPMNIKADFPVFALHLRNGILYAGGAFLTLNGVARSYLGAVDTVTGTLTDWDPAANDRVRAITSTAAGDIVVGGFFTEVGGQTIDHIDRLDATTGASLSWSYPSSAEVVGLVTGPDDHVYGAIAGGGGKVRAWSNTGTLLWTVFTDGDVNAVSYYGGQVIAGGHWVYMTDGTVFLPRLAAFDPATGQPDLSWQPKPNKQIWSFATDSTTLSVGGVFTRISAQAHPRLAYFQPSPA